MRLFLRMKFTLLMMPFVIMSGLLIYFMIRPFASIKMHVRDVRHDIVQVSSAERFSRSLYKQHNTLALATLQGSTVGLEKQITNSGVERADILASWRKELNAAFFYEKDKGRIILQNFQAIEKASNQIQEYALAAVKALSSGDKHSTLSAMSRIDLIIDTTVKQKIDLDNSILVAEVMRNLPLTVDVLRQVSLMPMLDIDRDVGKLREEFSNSLDYSKIARLVNEQHQEIEDILIGSNTKRKMNVSSLEALMKLLEHLSGKEMGVESDREEHAFEIASTTTMKNLVNELERINQDTIKFRHAIDTNKKALQIISELGRIEGLFSKEIENLISREEREISATVSRIVRRIDSVYTTVIAICALILVISSFGAFALYKSIISPILRLRLAASNISLGNFETAIMRSSSDEIGELSETFDRMRQDLSTAINRLNDEVAVRKQTEEEKENIIKELKRVLAEIKTLSGLLPICSSCKKVRDDKGYWTQVESYISKHTQAEFTHGYCPDCADKVREEIRQLKNKL